LSPSARSKVISKSGSNLQSEKESYGFCEYYDCPYSSRFYLKIQCRDDFVLYEKDNPHSASPFYGITFENVERARDALERFKKGQRGEVGGYYLEERIGIFSIAESTLKAQRKQSEIMKELRYHIENHERSESVFEPMLEIRDEGCSII